MGLYFKQVDVFPAVERVVREKYREHAIFITHGELVKAVAGEPEIQAVIRRLSSSRRNLRASSIVSNIVAWFSQQITVGRSQYAPYFSRKRIGGVWAYRPVTADLPLGADPDLDAIEGDGVIEGEARLVAHLHRERNPALAKRKKEEVLRTTGRLACEACDFEFGKVYPVIGDNFCEVHHRAPLALASKARVVKLADLAILCANCHRMIHRTRPVESVLDFRRRLAPPKWSGGRRQTA